jgi:hypothetical protein
MKDTSRNSTASTGSHPETKKEHLLTDPRVHADNKLTSAIYAARRTATQQDPSAALVKHPYRDAAPMAPVLAPEVDEVPIRAPFELSFVRVLGLGTVVALVGAALGILPLAVVVLPVWLAVEVLVLTFFSIKTGFAAAFEKWFGQLGPPKRYWPIGAVSVAPGGWIVRWRYTSATWVEPRERPVECLLPSRWAFVADADLQRAEAARFVIDRISDAPLRDGERAEAYEAIVEDVVCSSRWAGLWETKGGSRFVVVLTQREMLIVAAGEGTWRAAMGVTEAPARCEARSLVRCLKRLAPMELVARVRRDLDRGASFAIARDVASARLKRAGTGWALDLHGLPPAPIYTRLLLSPSRNERDGFDRWRAGRVTS